VFFLLTKNVLFSSGDELYTAVIVIHQYWLDWHY